MEEIKDKFFINSLFRIFKGVLISAIITLILLFIFSAILTYTNISENTINPAVLVITAISVLIGSMISSLKKKKNGFINGGIVGFIYFLILYLLSGILGNECSFSIYSIAFIIICILFGIIGGIIGVNT